MTGRRVARRLEGREPDLFAAPDPPADVRPSEPSAASRVARAPARSREVPAPERIAPPEPAASDAYPGETAQSAVSVSVLTQTARDVIEGAFIPLWVRGEISDFKSHRNGHWYFCLRDGTSQIRCVVWKRDQRGIPAAPDDGMQVAAFGRLTVYPGRGEMQYGVTRLEAEGDGLRRKALEITHARLEADGLLALERKRSLPRFPRVIAVVTSPDGAALHDIVAVLRRRGSHVRVVVVPAAVQGENAPNELIAALDRVNRWGQADLVIVGRGGGSREDLWAFNHEGVARAVAACHAPTISAVGHEVDTSICDLVADHRAPTPSAAAEAATVSRAELVGELREVASRICNSTIGGVQWHANRLVHARRDLASAAAVQVARRESSLASVAGRLHALSPLATLARGFCIARDGQGATLASTADFGDGLAFTLVVRNGTVPATVTGTPAENES